MGIKIFPISPKGLGGKMSHYSKGQLQTLLSAWDVLSLFWLGLGFGFFWDRNLLFLVPDGFLMYHEHWNEHAIDLSPVAHHIFLQTLKILDAALTPPTTL